MKSETAQWVKVLATKLDVLSAILKAHMVEGQIVLWSSHIHFDTPVTTHSHTYKNKTKCEEQSKTSHVNLWSPQTLTTYQRTHTTTQTSTRSETLAYHTQTHTRSCTQCAHMHTHARTHTHTPTQREESCSLECDLGFSVLTLWVQSPSVSVK